jgi:hypothetical protein
MRRNVAETNEETIQGTHADGEEDEITLEHQKLGKNGTTGQSVREKAEDSVYNKGTLRWLILLEESLYCGCRRRSRLGGMTVFCSLQSAVAGQTLYVLFPSS